MGHFANLYVSLPCRSYWPTGTAIGSLDIVVGHTTEYQKKKNISFDAYVLLGHLLY